MLRPLSPVPDRAAVASPAAKELGRPIGRPILRLPLAFSPSFPSARHRLTAIAFAVAVLVVNGTFEGGQTVTVAMLVPPDVAVGAMGAARLRRPMVA